MEQLKHMEEVLMGCVQAQLSHLDTVDTEELGQAIDMIKSLSRLNITALSSKQWKKPKRTNLKN